MYHLDSIVLPLVLQSDTTSFMIIEINFNSVNNKVSYCYHKYGCGQHEYYFKECYPSNGCFKYEPNTIFNLAQANKLIAADTLFNVIITKPSRQKYEVYRSVCLGGVSKEKATMDFMQQILGQYKLLIFRTENKLKGYFVVPPKPSDTFRLKHTKGHF